MRHLTILFFTAMLSASTLAQGYPDFTDLIESASPAVVKINTVMSAPTAGPQAQVPDFLREFFDYYQYPQPQQRDAQSVGSGFIISDDGYVLTNNHVVEGATQITVRLIDRREYAAEVVGLDPLSDLALLKIDADNLPAVEFAAPEALEVGDWVVAIGSPFNMDYSASAGIVSAVGRSLGSGQNYVPFIQTDVAINPGNSGGPLFNLDGEVVGINSQIFTRSGGYMGLSFAIPASVAMDVVQQLQNSGRVARGWLGVYISPVDQELAEAFGLDRPRGALINQVIPNSPAAATDLRPGDIVIAFDGQEINYEYELPNVVGLKVPGNSYPVTLVRQGREMEIDVRVGELPTDETAQASPKIPSGPQPDQNTALLGMVVEDMDPRTASELRVSGGVVVRSVVPDSPAADTGVLPGDIIVQLGYQPITSVQEFEQVVRSARSGQRLPLRIFRSGNSHFRSIVVE